MCRDMSRPRGRHRSAGTACLLLLSLQVKSEPGSVLGGEAGGLISAPVCPQHETARQFRSLVGVEEILKAHVWHHNNVSAENS